MKQGWEIKKLGECFEYIKNGANIKQERGAGGIPITRIETLSGGVFNRDRLGYADIKTIDKYQSYVMESGDLLLSHINSKSYIGRVVVYVKEGNETIIHGMNLLRLKVIPDIISPFYMYYYSQTHKFKSQIANRRKDAVNQSSISVTDLKTIDVPIPPREEQERIVAELDCLSGVIEKKREQLRELDALAQSIFYQMFGDPITNEKGFPVYKIDDIITFQGGSQPDKSHFEYEPTDDNIRLIQIRDYKSDKNITYIPKSLARRLCNAEDIMIGRYGPPIFQILKGIEGAYNVALMKAIPKQGNREFIRAFLKQKCLLEYLESMSKRTAGQDGIQMDKLKAYPFPLPPIELQDEFADKIEAIEKQKELIKQSITQTEELFISRMDYYFN